MFNLFPMPANYLVDLLNTRMHKKAEEKTANSLFVVW